MTAGTVDHGVDGGGAGNGGPGGGEAAGHPPAPRTAPRVVALGGGHGLAASLTALRGLTEDLTAVVTVADDGGSSGRLRRDLGVLPPGDLRMALAALCGDDEWGRTWSRVIQHRFACEGELNGHAVGNLLIAALWDLLDEPVDALRWVGRLLGAHGTVLPMSGVPLTIEAEVLGHDPARPGESVVVVGQHQIAVTPGEVRGIRLVPHDPPAVPEAVAAVREADWVVVGPGSWFTSVLPNLLVPELAAALLETKARRVLALNLMPQPGETEGFSPERHLEVLAEHAPGLRFDVVLGDIDLVPDVVKLERAARALGGNVLLAPVAADDGTARHDPARLAAAYGRIFLERERIAPWR